MSNKKKLAAVIPCYKGGTVTLQLIKETLKYVDLIVLVDDCCPFKTGNLIKKNIIDERIIIIFNEYNLGVGGSTKKGFKYLLDSNVDIFIKLDADGQMNPHQIPKLINPIIEGKADMTKGNRFLNLDNLSSMPKIRLFGNLCVSFLARAATGYWELFDSTNGFIAIDKNILKLINLNKLDNRYFFETDLLFRMGLINAIVVEVNTDIIYENHISSLNPIKEIRKFSIKLLLSFFKRLCYQYFLFDLNIGSLELLMTILFGTSALLWNMYVLIKSIITNKISSTGTIGIGIILTISTLQFLLAFINYDVSQRKTIKRLKH